MKALLAICSIVAALAAAGAANAGGNGAIVANSSTCVQTPIFRVCSDLKSTTNVTDTPSGNRSYVTNGTIDVTLSNPFCSVTQSQATHTHWLQKDGELATASERFIAVNQLQCGSSSQTCTTTQNFHYAGGSIQFDRPDLVCTTP